MPSTVIKGFQYDEPGRTLRIEFTSGDLYCYSDVPPAVASGLAGAFSKGRYFAHHIRDKFAYRRLCARGLSACRSILG
jgi:hypothetical protein